MREGWESGKDYPQARQLITHAGAKCSQKARLKSSPSNATLKVQQRKTGTTRKDPAGPFFWIRGGMAEKKQEARWEAELEGEVWPGGRGRFLTNEGPKPI